MSEELLLLLVEVWARLMYRLSSFICRGARAGDSRWVRGGVGRLPQANCHILLEAPHSFGPSAAVQHIPQQFMCMPQYFIMVKSPRSTDVMEHCSSCICKL